VEPDCRSGERRVRISLEAPKQTLVRAPARRDRYHRGTCSRAALDANIEHGACIYPSRWDGGESYTLAGVGSIPTSGTTVKWVVQIRSGGRSSGCKPDPFRARGSIPSTTHHFLPP